ncbi:hypothetical protein L3X38_028081 [Prunus dulcis]|uniref:Reverse transcriptase domain-containing protein n=1 Tax=Prunus dulcis TaxID=3755 RepID=A0AAD4VQP1_PRUDU|nr:hypothetical protein L3X38_028081 [Prunus dulcis]
MCVDYTDLNKACPKDNFPLPRIDQLVDSTSGNQLLSFMDAYFSDNQIMMLVNKIFKEQIGKTMEVYVDDMLVKAPKCGDHLKNLIEAFSLLRQYRMKLNPKGAGTKIYVSCIAFRDPVSEDIAEAFVYLQIHLQISVSV